VAQAWPYAETDQEVPLIRCIAAGGARVIVKEEAVKDRDEAQGGSSGLSHGGLNKGVSTHRGAKDRVARGYSGALTTQQSSSACSVSGELRVTEEANGAVEGSGGSSAGGREGEEGAIDGGLAKGEVEASRDEG
jgi:hypothetical protein